MSTWLEDIVISLDKHGGCASLNDIYKDVKKVHTEKLPTSWKKIICKTINRHSSDRKDFSGVDLFHSVKGKGSGIWELRIGRAPEAPDSKVSELTERQKIGIYRIIRDTVLTRDLKEKYDNRCQICGVTIEITKGHNYSEAHHIKPLGKPHNGPDDPSNIIILCPNHHVSCDYRSIRLDINSIKKQPTHEISQKYINYHPDSALKM